MHSFDSINTGNEKMTFKDLSVRIDQYSKDDFQKFCQRYQKVMNVKFRPTKALGSLGDLSTDGIISKHKRLAVFGPENNIDYNDGDNADKMEKDFKGLMTKHDDLKTMVYMTKTTEGMGPKTQLKKNYLESDEYQKQFNRSGVTIEYVDKFDIFHRLKDIENGETIDYIFNDVIQYKRMPVTLSKYLDDPAFISECLIEASRRFDNQEAPEEMKIRELLVLIQVINDKIDRDIRKYNVSNETDIPYSDWDILKIGEDQYDPLFDVPRGLHIYYQEKFPLNPLVLREIFKDIIYRLMAVQYLRLNKDWHFYEEKFAKLFAHSYHLKYAIELYDNENEETNYRIGENILNEKTERLLFYLEPPLE